MSTTKIQKWGNSLGVRLPAHVLKTVGLHQGSKVEVVVEDAEGLLHHLRLSLDEY